MSIRENVRKYGLLVYINERLFYFLLYLSPATWWLSTRTKSQEQLESKQPENGEQAARSRGRRIEYYMGMWFFLLVMCGLLAFVQNHFIRKMVTFIALYRVFDIMIAAVNISLFDRIRLGRQVDYVSGVERNLLLSLWNFFEILLAFGIIYSAYIELLANSGDGLDAYYFSVITQLTIGYGDMVPLGHLKMFSMAQGLVGLLFVLLVLGRFVSLLPRARDISDRK